ncbi:MAG: hypothetical protein WDW36_003186 [Sanguina aurantia]
MAMPATHQASHNTTHPAGLHPKGLDALLPSGSPATSALQAQRESSRLEVAAVLQGLAATATRERYLWASTIVASRGVQLWRGPTLVPVLDMLNHRHPPSVVCMPCTGAQGEQQLSIQAIRNMKQGDELCWCYSAHDNDAAWLLNYGFVPSDGVSSNPTLPPHVLAEFPSPSSSTEPDSQGSTSSHGRHLVAAASCHCR